MSFKKQNFPFGSTVHQNMCGFAYLVHVWLDQHLSYQSLSISSLVYGGIRPQAVAHHVHVGCLQTLDQHALQRLLQHGGDPRDTLTTKIFRTLTKKSAQKLIIFVN